MKHFLNRTAAVCLCVLIFFTFAGCSGRTAVTEEAFTAAMKGLGHTEQESLAQQSAAQSGADVCHIYTTESSGVAEYLLFSDAASARSAYAKLISSIDGQPLEKLKAVDSATYNRAEYTDSEGRLTLIRTENMLLTLNAPEEEVRSMLDKLGLS